MKFAFDRNPRYSYGTSTNVNGVWRNPAAVLIEKCDRFHRANATILDSDSVGLLLRDTANTRVSGCMIRGDRTERKATRSL